MEANEVIAILGALGAGAVLQTSVAFFLRRKKNKAEGVISNSDATKNLLNTIDELGQKLMAKEQELLHIQSELMDAQRVHLIEGNRILEIQNYIEEMRNLGAEWERVTGQKLPKCIEEKLSLIENILHQWD
jgi:uncharacterized protein HemX